MMKFSGVCLITDDVPALVKFYVMALGQPAEGDDEHATFELGGAGLAIFTRRGMEQMAPGSMVGYAPGGCTLMFEVADVDAEFERLTAQGVEMVKPPLTYPWGSRSFWFRDPEGNIVDFMMRVDQPAV